MHEQSFVVFILVNHIHIVCVSTMFVFLSDQSKLEIVRREPEDQRRISSSTLSPGQTKNSSSNDRMNYAGDENSGESSDQSD